MRRWPNKRLDVNPSINGKFRTSRMPIPLIQVHSDRNRRVAIHTNSTYKPSQRRQWLIDNNIKPPLGHAATTYSIPANKVDEFNALIKSVQATKR